jgi:hypothetical protein
MTYVNSFFSSMTMAQISRLFSLHPSAPGRREADPANKAASQASEHASEADRSRGQPGVARNVMEAIQSLVSQASQNWGDGSSRSPGSAGSLFMEQFKALIGGEDFARDAAAAVRSMGTYSLSFTQSVTLASATTLRRDGTTFATTIKVDFGFLEGAAIGDDRYSALLGCSIRSLTTVTFGSQLSGGSRSYGECSRRQDLRLIDPAPGQRSVDSFMMTSGKIEGASLWSGGASIAFARATQTIRLETSA